MRTVTVPYTLFKEEVAKRNVDAIYVRGESISGRFKTPVPVPLRTDRQDTTRDADARTSTGADSFIDRLAARLGMRGNEQRTATHFTSTLPSFVDPGLEAFLIDHSVEISDAASAVSIACARSRSPRSAK